MSALLSSKRTNVWFELGPHLGGGGFADVYRCLAIRYCLADELPPLAIKILRDAWDPEIFWRFVAEARILNAVRHPNLVPAVEINLQHNPPYYVMPLMKETLEERLREWRQRGEVYRAKYAIEHVILPICRVLGMLHSRQIFHRDLKPANIFFDAAGVARLGDLGICHFPAVYFPDVSLRMIGIGTEGYSAPETLRFGIGSAQSDVYSVGIVLYEMIMGFLPPRNWWHRAECRPSLRHPNSSHAYVDQVIAMMIDPNPKMRYANISAAVRDLIILNRDYLSRLPAYAQPAPRFKSLADALRLQQFLPVAYEASPRFPRLADLVKLHEAPRPLGLQPAPQFQRLVNLANLLHPRPRLGQW